MSSVLTARVPENILKDLDQLAHVTQRARSWIVNQALQSYVETQNWQLKTIKEGLEDFEEDRVEDHVSVKEWLNTWGSSDEDQVG